jgi:amino acid adenylation domain-containing protein
MRIDRLVAPWALRAPDRVAITGPAGALTYRELDELANRFAHLFRELGVRPGDRVGVHLPRSARTVAAMLGASRAGAVYVPLDPGSPPQRMKVIATDCQLRHVVISRELLASWRYAGVCEPVEHFVLGGDGPLDDLSGPASVHPWAEVLGSPATPLPPAGESPDELAYILYTSGSTGVPKGVMISHRNALAFVDWACEQIALDDRDRVASVAPFHFDLSVFDLWGSLSRGATVAIVDEAMVGSGRRMLDRIREARISVWYSVPTALVLMLEQGDLAECGSPSLRCVFFAGEVFPVRHLRRTMAAIPHARFFNLFGPTETNVCLAYEVKEPPPAEASGIPIGAPSCGDTMAILDPEGRPVAPGEIGELFIEGPTVMLGYWDAGRRTPAPHPYPTGDLVSLRPDGQAMYHGRRDHLVKIHGFRVELGEVEAAVSCHAGIQEALVMAVDQQLVLVAVPTDPSVSVLDVKRHCATRLPQYMVPVDVRLVKALPRTSSGKADRVRTRAAVVENDAVTLTPVHATQALRKAP